MLHKICCENVVDIAFLKILYIILSEIPKTQLECKLVSNGYLILCHASNSIFLILMSSG